MAVSRDKILMKLWFVLQQHVPVLSGGVAMDSVSHLSNVVMGTGSVLMAVMNSTAVSMDQCSIYTGFFFVGGGGGGAYTLRLLFILTVEVHKRSHQASHRTCAYVGIVST